MELTPSLGLGGSHEGMNAFLAGPAQAGLTESPICATNASSKTISTGVVRLRQGYQAPPLIAQTCTIERRMARLRDRGIDLTRIGGAPSARMRLGDMGAEVIKGRAARRGQRRRYPQRGDALIASDGGLLFPGVKPQKQAIADINMAIPADRKIIAGLIEKAPTFHRQFKVGKAREMELTGRRFDA